MSALPETAPPDPVSVARDGVIATVTLNRPERLNALDRSMWGGLRDAMRSERLTVSAEPAPEEWNKGLPATILKTTAKASRLSSQSASRSSRGGEPQMVNRGIQ